jgi:predicted NUDIX family phosphoesterase
MKDKKILVVKTPIFFPEGIWEGFRDVSTFDPRPIVEKDGEYLLRPIAEENPTYQQIITQVLLVVNKKIFFYRIPKTGNESRLHDMWPMFLGGHIDEVDNFDLEVAVKREFEEEINYQGQITEKRFLGTVKLNDNPVDRVHVGLIWLYKGDSERFLPTEDRGLVDGRFFTLEEMKAYENKMSYWTKVMFQELEKLI